MLRYVFVLILVNIYSRSMGLPVTPPTSNDLLLQPLIALAANCANPYIVKQINSTRKACEVTSTPIGKEQLRCLMFYDISYRLCTDHKQQFTVQEIGKLNEQGDVATLCDGASTLTASNLTEYPLYKSIVEKSFKNPAICIQLCETEVFGSSDPNLYCKYFNWGSQLLRQQLTSPTGKPSLNDVPTSNDLPSKFGLLSASDVPPVNLAPSANTAPSSGLRESSDKNNEKALVADSNAIPVASVIDPSNTAPSDVSVKNKNNSSIANVAESSKVDQINVNAHTSKQNQAVETLKDTPEKASENEMEARNEDVKPMTDDFDKPQEDEDSEIASQMQEPIDVPKDLKETDTEIEKPKPAEIDDFQDAEEGKDDFTDTQGGDDGDDPKIVEAENKPDSSQGKDTVLVSTVKRPPFIIEKEFIPNTIQESFSEDDNDNFFSFFLTAVILVVLIYVLYHNKSKVSKVFLGLVVEGRQPGRRRNSRGHAYKRLDTLEQAMSTNANAPPSKIIY